MNGIVVGMKSLFTLVLSVILSACYSFAKCKGYDDLKPSYCVKIITKSTPENYKDGCIVGYELVDLKPALPLEREYPYWKQVYFSEGDEHFIKLEKTKCEKVRKEGNAEIKGISSQLCYDVVSYEAEAWIWLKERFGIRTIKPSFEFSEKTTVHFHDKGLLEVSCPNGF